MLHSEKFFLQKVLILLHTYYILCVKRLLNSNRLKVRFRLVREVKYIRIDIWTYIPRNEVKYIRINIWTYILRKETKKYVNWSNWFYRFRKRNSW